MSAEMKVTPRMIEALLLNRLRAAGLAHFRHEYGYYTATISQRGRDTATHSADLVQGDAKLRGNSGDADATENHKDGSRG